MNRTVKQGIDNCYMVHKHEHPGYEENRCAGLEEAIKDYHLNKTPTRAYFNLENWLYEQDDKPVEIKSAMIWGGLWIIKDLGCISWDEMRNLYGEFMSKQMNLR